LLPEFHSNNAHRLAWREAHREDVRAYNREYQRRRRASCEREGGPHGASERLDLTTCTALGLGLVAQDDGELLRLLILGVLAKADRP